MGKKNLVVAILFILFLASVSFIPISSADGGFFVPTIEYWIGAPEEKQIGLIDYTDGRENLIIVIDIKNSSLQSEKAVWIFPIPADPEEVSVDVLSDIPYFKGKGIDSLARDNLWNTFFLMMFSQSYTFPVLFYYYAGMLGAASEDTLLIYDHIEKMGLTTELIGTTNSSAFEDYLNQKSLNFSAETSSILDYYINKSYSFVVSWISDVEEFRKEALVEDYYYYYYANYDEPFFILGVSVDFPSENIYYPMKLTSIYGEKKIPILLQIKDFITPLTEFENMDVNYLLDGSTSYTEITIRSKSEDLTQDLWAEDKAPSETLLPGFIASNGVLFAIILFVFSSCFASLLAGMAVYFNQKPIIHKFVLLGLFNFLTFIGFVVANRFTKTSQTFVKKPIDTSSSNDKKFERNAFLTLILSYFSLVFIILCFWLYNPDSIIGVAIYMSFFGIFIAVLTFLGFLTTKDKQRTAFVILFSVFFITISIPIHLLFLSVL